MDNAVENTNVLFQLLDNAAFMGVVGLVAGGLITFLSGFVQAVYNNRYMEKMRCFELAHKQLSGLYEKKESAYKKFLMIRSVFLSVQAALNSKTATDDEKATLLAIYREQLIESQLKSPELFAELSLYGKEDISDKCGEFSSKYEDYSNDQIEEMNNDLNEIIGLMNEDLKKTIPQRGKRL